MKETPFDRLFNKIAPEAISNDVFTLVGKDFYAVPERGTQKMKEVALTSIKTPFGNRSFQEARLIFECKLTTLNLNDYYTQEAKEYVHEMYQDPKEIRKYIFG